ncbi:hypothetical protein [Marilutibacter alkalisoli]|uniref:Uncharacterized protein n=1 Tax=Marilutibacter alkalisoli TaxID=2591633 RepID=A0A514BVG5_9GAMM|nr:hypothetical protein [Lysobacter alkalisoli]QDH71352.1 hypothetical protein FKV23_15590 [Lysobacter alkalisoli]
MNNMTQTRRPIVKQRLALLALAMAGLLASGNAAAQWIVNDTLHVKTQLAEFTKEATRWGEQGRQWLKEYQQFMQQYNSFLSSANQVRASYNLPDAVPMRKVEDDEYVEERCGPRYGGGSAGVLGRMFQVDLRGDVQQQRYEVCALIQQMRNRQLNDTVDYLQKTMPQMKADLIAAGDRFIGSGKTQGDMTTYSAEFSQVGAGMAQSHEEFQALMQAYEKYINALESAQGTLTRAAMRGHSGLPSKIVNVATMKTALCGTSGSKCRD